MKIPRRTHGSKGLATMMWKLRRESLGDEHPATRGAFGRLQALRGNVPQQDSMTPEAVAWKRESGSDRGFWNRHHRRRVYFGSLRHPNARIPVDSHPSVDTVEAQ